MTMKIAVGNRIAVIATAAVLCISALPGASVAQAQGRGGGRGGAGRGGGSQITEDGIPVTDALTISKCASCHAKDDKGNLSRISWIRTTPEGWEEAIKRMVRLNGLTLEPADAKLIVKYLSTSHGLAPEEAKPVMYMTEHRIQDEVIPNESVRSTCNYCHALGRVFQWHRTREEWSLLADTHSALYTQAEAAFRRGARGGAATAAAGGRGRGGAAAGNEGDAAGGATANAAAATPISLDTTLDFLGKNYGLHSPEWSTWRARMRAPNITGRCLISAHLLGRG
jgi:quinohemoprotein amine dehydrogenase